MAIRSYERYVVYPDKISAFKIPANIKPCSMSMLCIYLLPPCFICLHGYLIYGAKRVDKVMRLNVLETREALPT